MCVVSHHLKNHILLPTVVHVDSLKHAVDLKETEG